MRPLSLFVIAAALFLVVRTGLVLFDGGPSARASEQTGEAPATAVEVAAADTADGDGSEAATEESGVLPAAALTTGLSDAEQAVLDEIAERRREVAARLQELDQREALLIAAEQRIEAKVGELTALRTQIQALVKQVNEQEEAELRSLVRIYESMKPKEAARIFEDLELAILLDIVSRMKERSSAAVLAAMAPDTARIITAELARRPLLPGEGS